MRCLLFLALIGGLPVRGWAVVRTWTGPSGGLWTVAANWLPAGTPQPGDDVVFSTSVTVSVDAPSPLSLRSISVTGSSTVRLDCSSTKNFRLTSTRSDIPALLVEAGSTFIFNSSNTGINNSTLDLTFGTGVVGSVYGTLEISNTGGATNGPRLDTYGSSSAYGILTVNNGGRIRILPNAENTDASLVPVPTLVMKNGSVYENLKNGGSFPEGDWESHSLAKALSPGSNGPGFIGSTYGNLEWDCPAQTSVSILNKDITFNHVTLISTNTSAFRIRSGSSAGITTLTILGSLTIFPAATLQFCGNTVTAGNGARLDLKGNLDCRGTLSTLGISGTVNDWLWAGTFPQQLHCSGSVTGTRLRTIMQNPAGVTLQTALTLPGDLELQQGRIHTSAASLLTLVDNAVCSGGSENSFVSGPVRKIGDDDFIFPTGKGSIYAPAGIAGGSGLSVTDEFTAEYIRVNPQSALGAVYGPGINHISYVEYWNIERGAFNLSTRTIRLPVHALSFCRQLARTFICRWDGSEWKNEATSILTGPVACGNAGECGTLVTGIPQTTGGFFTLATDLPVQMNPLPLTWKAFSVQQQPQGQVRLSWSFAEPVESGTRFIPERSSDGIGFSPLGQVTDRGRATRFVFSDSTSQPGTNWYRVRALLPNGEYSFSPVRRLNHAGVNSMRVRLYPNPVSADAYLYCRVPVAMAARLRVTTSSGRQLLVQTLLLKAGENRIRLETAGWPSGLFFWECEWEGSKVAGRLLKQ